MSYELRNQDLYLDGRWIAHLFVSGSDWYGVVDGWWFLGKSQDEVAEQIEVAFSGKECD